jgi:oxygen-independent coproporphyrinogen III oxidase
VIAGEMDPALLATYDRPVPRYTSYPTAAQFTAAVGSGEHARWLGELAGSSASLYVHVPFCEQLCWYCACHTMAMRSPGTLDAYARALLGELELLARQVADLQIASIQWGGGTPSQLGASRLLEVAKRIDKLFDRRCDGEVSMEVDPRYCTDELVEAMAAAGVTRASLGVQDFDEAVQKAINRSQSFEVTAAALTRLRDRGIRQTNIDLVYGLPGQTLDKLSRTLDQAISLKPNRFAVFAYAHVPWMKPHQKLIDASTLPDGVTRGAMAELVAERLVAADYRPIGLDHYARSGDPLARAAATSGLRRSFQGYVASGTPWVIGIGASAISSMPAGYTQNTADVAAYMAALEQGRFATARGVALNDDDRLRGEIISQLMCTHEVDVGKVCASYDVPADGFLKAIEGLSPLCRDRLVALEDGRLKVTERGRPLLRVVCAAFDRYYTAGEGRHSRL